MMMDLKPYLPHSFVSSTDPHDASCYPDSMPGSYSYHYSHHSHYNPAYPMSQSSWTPDYTYQYPAHPPSNEWDEYRNCYPPSSASPESSSSLGHQYPDSTGQANPTPVTGVVYEEPQPTYQDLRHMSPSSSRFHDTGLMDRSASDAPPPPPKRRIGVPGTGKKERRRTISLNSAFSTLRSRIPKVPVDTKLSKIKTLRLASLYIQYLNKILNGPQDGPQMQPNDFEVDLHQFKRNRSSTRTLVTGSAASASTSGTASTSSRTLPSPAASTTSCSTSASSDASDRITKGNGKAVDGTMSERKGCSSSGGTGGHHQDHYHHQVGKGRTGWSEAVWKEQVRSGASLHHSSFLPPSHVSCHHHPNQLQQHQPENLQHQQVSLPAYIN